MKPIVLWLLLVVVIIGSSIISYFNSTYYIKSQDWKYSNGFHHGDWFSKNTFEINERVISSNKRSVKIVFCWGQELIIKDIKTGEIGNYSIKN